MLIKFREFGTYDLSTTYIDITTNSETTAPAVLLSTGTDTDMEIGVISIVLSKYYTLN